MPLFMDRHDVPGVTAEQVAQAHMADLDMGPSSGCSSSPTGSTPIKARHSAWRKHPRAIR